MSLLINLTSLQIKEKYFFNNPIIHLNSIVRFYHCSMIVMDIFLEYCIMADFFVLLLASILYIDILLLHLDYFLCEKSKICSQYP